MNYRYSSIVIFCLVAFLIVSCDSQITQPDTDPPLLDIPAYGTDAFPQLDSANFKSSSAKNQNQATKPPAYDLLTQYADEHPDDPYVAVVGVWNVDEERYDYKSIPLSFPDSILNAADENVGYYRYKLDGDSRSVRNLAAFIPPAPDARIMMNQWLRLKEKETKADSSGKASAAKTFSNIIASSGGDGLGCKDVILPDGTWYFYDCQELVVTPNDGPEVPETNDEWPSTGGDSGSTGGGSGGTGGGTVGGCPMGCGGGGGSIPFGEHILSNYPAFQYPEDANYEKQFPKMTEYLKNKIPNLKDNETIINAIKEFTSLTEDEIVSDLQWGEGPTIKIKELDDACPTCGTDTYGLYDDDVPDIINIDIDLANQFENLNIGNDLGDPFTFFIGVTILHEYIHYGDNDGSDYPGEEGNLFEEHTYGEIVLPSNMGQILYRDRN